MMCFKEYVLCTRDGIIGKIHLRETRCFYISETGEKYKKVDSGAGGALAVQHNGSGFHRYTYYIHTVDSDFVKVIQERDRRRHAVHRVRKYLDELSASIRNYDDALKIAEKLGFEVE